MGMRKIFAFIYNLWQDRSALPNNNYNDLAYIYNRDLMNYNKYV